MCAFSNQRNAAFHHEFTTNNHAKNHARAATPRKNTSKNGLRDEAEAIFTLQYFFLRFFTS